MSHLARACAFLAILAVSLHAETQKIPHGTVELVSRVKSIQAGATFEAGLLFHLEPGWHIYWKNPGDSGLPPRLAWHLPDGLKAQEIAWPAPKRLPVGSLLDYGYEGTVLLPIPIEAASTLPKNPQTLSASLKVLVCRESCIPGKAELSLKLPVLASEPQPAREHASLFADATAAQPKPLPNTWKVEPVASPSQIELALHGVPATAIPSFIPAQNDLIRNAAPQHLETKNGTLHLTLKRPEEATGHPQNVSGLLFVEDGDRTVAYTLEAPVIAAPAPLAPASTQAPATANPSILGVLALAFGGGIILNLMPCVFPVLSIKILGLIDHAHGERKTIQMSAVLYTLGVLVSFWALVAVLLGFRGAGRNLGWGFQLQAPGFVAFLVCLLFVLGLSLIGTFEIGTSLMSAGGGLTTGGKYSSSFFTGVLATVVATPCTAPLMGVAVGFALSQSAALCTLVFTSMALGLAFPFLLLSLFPNLSRFLPRPGAWMETLKQVLAFPVFLTVIWLLWVLGQQVGMNDVAVLLVVLLVLSIAGWMAGRWPQSRVTKTAAVLLGIAAVGYSSVSLTHAEANTNRTGALPSNLKWEPFTPEKLAAYRASGKPVFVDFTAAWCLTCQVNDRVVFHSPQVEQYLNKSDIALLRADWTSYDPKITDFLATFGRSGIPFYIVYGATPQAPPLTLPDGLLTPGVFLDHLHRANL